MLALPADELVSTAAPWPLRAALCWRAPLSFLWSSSAFFAPLAIGLADETLAWLRTLNARAVPIFGPAGGTNLGILDNGGPRDGDRMGRRHRRLTLEASASASKQRKLDTGAPRAGQTHDRPSDVRVYSLRRNKQYC